MGGIKKGSHLSPEHRHKIGEGLRKHHSHTKHSTDTIDSLIFKVVLPHSENFNSRFIGGEFVKYVLIRKDRIEHHLSILKGKLSKEDFKRLKEAIWFKFGVKA